MEKAENRQPSFFYWRSQRAVDEVQKDLQSARTLFCMIWRQRGLTPSITALLR